MNVTLQQTTYTISGASYFLETSVDTILRWEKKGILRPARNDKGHRFFTHPQLNAIKQKHLSGSQGKGFYVLKAPKPSPYRVIELFAGAGGLALGLSNAGLQTTALVEIDPHACNTLRHNRPEWNVMCEDVANVSFNKGDAEVVTGGFPCQAFSYAGKKLGFEDIRGTLFFEFARIVKEVQPAILVGENVRGLERHDDGRTLKTMLGILEQLGYTVQYKIVRAQYLDVAQKRERLVIIGVRNDLNIPILFPQEQDYVLGVRDALHDVPDSPGQSYTTKKHDVMKLVPEGGYWRDLPEPIKQEYMGGSYLLGGGKTGIARRLAWDEPSLTLTCNPAQKQTERCHPSETRPLRVREYARIQSFPDDWVFTGSMANQYKQIGNAVPVNLGYHIGRCLIDMLNQA